MDVDIAALSDQEEKSPSVRINLIAGYAQQLRAIGQALEVLKFGDFTVRPDAEGYRVTGAAPSIASRGDVWPVDHLVLCAPAMELSYSRNDVKRLERDGRTQRRRGHGTMDSSRLSQALRVIGSYLTQKYSRMLRVSREGDRFEVHYESSLGSRFSEQFSVSDIYDLSVRFYLQRSMRSAAE